MRHIFLFEDDEADGDYAIIGESFSSHRFVCDQKIVAGNLIEALRKMADAIEETNIYYKGIPDQ